MTSISTDVGNTQPTGILIDLSRVPNRTADTFVFDCTVRSDHSRSAEIADAPIEANDGDVSDHRRIKPTEWEFSALLVNEIDAPVVPTAFNDRDPLAAHRAAAPVNVVRALNQLQILKLIFESSETVDIYTETDHLTRAVLADLRWHVVASTPDQLSGQMVPSAIEVSGRFRQLRFATTEEVDLPAEEVKRQTGKKKNFGTVNAKETTPEVKEQAETLLRRGVRFVFGKNLGGGS
jgi:hypothetical protein